jgi:hypothetical protein
MIRPALLILVPALAFPILSYRTIVGDSVANAALAEAEVPPVPEAPVFDMREEETYAVILERPLFSPSRRPASPAAAAEAPAASSDGLALLGIASAQGRSIALIRPEAGAPAIKARTGEEVAGWQLVTIGSSDVLMERQGAQLALELAFKSPAPVMAPAILAPQPAAGAQPEPQAEPEEPQEPQEPQQPQS